MVEGVEVFYLDRGAGEALLLVHGWASCSYTWRYNMPALAHHFRVLAPDLPGFGLSQKLPSKFGLEPVSRHLLRFLDLVGVQKFSLVGMSMGGAISSYIAATNSERVRKLVLVNPAIFGLGLRRRVMAELLSRSPLYEMFGRILTSRWAVRAALRKVYVKSSVVDENLLDAYYRSIKRSGRTLLEALQIMKEFDPGCLLEVKCPVLFVLGGRDRLIPYEKNIEVAKSIGAKVFVDPDSGHVVHEENPRAVNDVIVEFLKA